MKKKTGTFLATFLLVLSSLSSKAFADLAPDPEPIKGAAPIMLYAIGVAVVLIISIIIIRSLGRRNSNK